MLENWLNIPHAIPLILVMWTAGLLGSVGHCAGMCGPIVLSFGVAQAESKRPHWQQHLLFQLGRITTYMILGAIIGSIGSIARLQSVQEMVDCCKPEGKGLLSVGAWPWQLWLKLTIGFVIMTLGIFLTFGRRADALMEFQLPDRIQGFLGRHIQWAHFPYWIGMIWGLIPCGLVFMMLLKSLEMGSWQMGALGMGSFGLGNLPLLFTLGLVSTHISLRWKQRLLRMSGLLVASLGIFILYQAIQLLKLVSGTP
ncbi:MAG: sulfite exporter TauE/SafE family protein [Holophagaceae bacterium]